MTTDNDTHKGDPSSALNRLIAETWKLAELPEDWDDEGGKPISRDAIRRAIAMVRAMNGPLPHMWPGPGVTVDIHWDATHGRGGCLVNVSGERAAWANDAGCGKLLTPEDIGKLGAWIAINCKHSEPK